MQFIFALYKTGFYFFSQPPNFLHFIHISSLTFLFYAINIIDSVRLPYSISSSFAIVYVCIFFWLDMAFIVRLRYSILILVKRLAFYVRHETKDKFKKWMRLLFWQPNNAYEKLRSLWILYSTDIHIYKPKVIKFCTLFSRMLQTQAEFVFSRNSVHQISMYMRNGELWLGGVNKIYLSHIQTYIYDNMYNT